MKRDGMFVEGLYEAPEVRVVEPGHLVRCGSSSVYDVNFGKEVGASAVVLLMKGLSGYTVIGMHHGRIHYMETAAAIEQRYVDLKEVSFYEQLGYCFGREPEETELELRGGAGADREADVARAGDRVASGGGRSA